MTQANNVILPNAEVAKEMAIQKMRSIIHPATERVKKDRYFYLFFLDPRSDKPVCMNRIKYLGESGTPADGAWVNSGIQRLPLFWIYEDDFLEAVGYSAWARDFEDKSIYAGAFSFPDYKECRAKGVGKFVDEEEE